MRLFFSALLFLCCTAARAQFAPESTLTVFSESGEKFFLILNGERQNDVAQTNVRVEALTQPHYNAVVIFENKRLPQINKTALQVSAPAAAGPADVAYRLRRDRNGRVKLSFYSTAPAVQNFTPPAGAYVHRFGTPLGAPPTRGYRYDDDDDRFDDRGVRSRSRRNRDDDGDARRRRDPREEEFSVGYGADPRDAGGYGDPAYAADCARAYPMRTADFEQARATLRSTAFDATRLQIAKGIADANCLSADQVSALCALFSFDQSRLEFAKHAYAHTTDPGAYFKVMNVFQFDASKSELAGFISGR